MTDVRVAGLLLIVAAASSLVAATMPSLARERVWMLPQLDYFRVIREHETQWRAHAWLFAIATVLMGIALGAVARSTGSGLALAAAILYGLVAPLWLADLAFRLDLTVWAARDGAAGAVFDALGHWSGSLSNIFMIGGFFAIALLGAALVDGALVPTWTAWVLVAFGTAAGLSHWASWPQVMGMRSPFDLPVLVQLVPLFVAIPLAAGG
jgi:hypothetical protein